MSGDPKQEYFCDGITEEIITAPSFNSSIFLPVIEVPHSALYALPTKYLRDY